MTDTPTNQTESKTDKVPAADPSDQKKSNRTNDRKRNSRNDSERCCNAEV